MDSPQTMETPARRSALIPALITVLLLQGCLYAGAMASPWFHARGWRPPARGLNDRIVEWRRSRYRPESDPRPGDRPPGLKLRTAAASTAAGASGGGTIDFARLRSAVLLFAGEEPG